MDNENLPKNESTVIPVIEEILLDGRKLPVGKVVTIPPGRHELVLRVSAEADAKSTGHAVRVTQLLAN